MWMSSITPWLDCNTLQLCLSILQTKSGATPSQQLSAVKLHVRDHLPPIPAPNRVNQNKPVPISSVTCQFSYPHKSFYLQTEFVSSYLDSPLQQAFPNYESPVFYYFQIVLPV